MSRSFKKAFVTVSKKWDRYKEKKYRRRIKRELHNIEEEINFNPDADFEASLCPDGIAELGTKFGLEYDRLNWLDDAPEWEETRDEMRRK